MTDMFYHSKLVQSLDSLVAAGPDIVGAPLMNTFDSNGRAIVLQMVVHAADISNTCRPPGPCGLWAKRVTDGVNPPLGVALARVLQSPMGLQKPNGTKQASRREGCAEFFMQGDKESKHGLPVTPILNRSTGHLASSQLAFVTYVTKPMMESLAPVLPQFVRMAQQHMQVNMSLYQEIIAEGTASRYKTIGVDYSTILAVHGKVTDDISVET